MLSHLPFKLRVKWCPSPFRGLHSDESLLASQGFFFFFLALQPKISISIRTPGPVTACGQLPRNYLPLWVLS